MRTQSGQRRLSPITLLLAITAAAPVCVGLNLPPYFTADMNQHTLVENTPVGSPVYTLEGQDPEGSQVKFGIQAYNHNMLDRFIHRYSTNKMEMVK